MSTFVIVMYLCVSGFMFYMAVATTDPAILSKPAAALAAILWPITVLTLFVIAQLYPDDPIEDSTTVGDGFDEAPGRLIAQD